MKPNNLILSLSIWIIKIRIKIKIAHVSSTISRLISLYLSIRYMRILSYLIAAQDSLIVSPSIVKLSLLFIHMCVQTRLSLNGFSRQKSRLLLGE